MLIKTIILLPIKLSVALTNIDLLDIALKNLGIGLHFEYNSSGEEYFIKSVLKKLVAPKPTFVDVGANLGTYSTMLCKAFPTATIYAFEPNPFAYNRLEKLFNNERSIKLFNKALGNNEGQNNLYIEKDNTLSQLASLNKNVYIELHKNTNIKAVSVNTTTIDIFMKTNHVDAIDFIKIDTEGNELEVLKGAKYALTNGKIKIIQFEFNEMNIISRIFLKDFYEIMPNYYIFRLAKRRLIPLEKYQSSFEIFRFQNFIAIRKDLLDITM